VLPGAVRWHPVLASGLAEFLEKCYGKKSGRLGFHMDKQTVYVKGHYRVRPGSGSGTAADWNQNMGSRIEERIGSLETTARELHALVDEKRQEEAKPAERAFFALSGREPLKEHLEEGERRQQQRETLAAQQYAPLETAITSHIESLGLLKADIATMIKAEGRRAFWSGFWTNALFFVMGLAVSAVSLSATQVFAFLGLR
jgi:hypothetical protein